MLVSKFPLMPEVAFEFIVNEFVIKIIMNLIFASIKSVLFGQKLTQLLVCENEGDEHLLFLLLQTQKH